MEGTVRKGKLGGGPANETKPRRLPVVTLIRSPEAVSLVNELALGENLIACGRWGRWLVFSVWMKEDDERLYSDRVEGGPYSHVMGVCAPVGPGHLQTRGREPGQVIMGPDLVDDGG